MATTNPTPGILYVTVQPKATLSLPQFHDWYNNEHGHLCLRLPFIKNGIRYQATDLKSDSQAPEWLTIYDVTDMKCLTEPTYASLKTNASPREQAIFPELELGRHLFDLVSSREKEALAPSEDAEEFTSVNGDKREGRVLVAVGMSLTAPIEESEREVNSWYETEHIPLLMKIPGWLRTRRFKTSSLGSDHSLAIEFVSLHEYENVNGLGGLEHLAAMDTPWRSVVREKYVASGWRRTYRGL